MLLYLGPLMLWAALTASAWTKPALRLLALCWFLQMRMVMIASNGVNHKRGFDLSWGLRCYEPGLHVLYLPQLPDSLHVVPMVPHTLALRALDLPVFLLTCILSYASRYCWVEVVGLPCLFCHMYLVCRALFVMCSSLQYLLQLLLSVYF